MMYGKWVEKKMNVSHHNWRATLNCICSLAMSASKLARLFLKSISLVVVTVLWTSTEEWEGLDLQRLDTGHCDIKG
jgi:hypothetical protein